MQYNDKLRATVKEVGYANTQVISPPLYLSLKCVPNCWETGKTFNVGCDFMKYLVIMKLKEAI